MRRDERYYGRFGGRYIPEVLRPAFEELEETWAAAREDRGYWELLERLGRDYVGRPTPLYEAERLSAELGIRLFLKLEGLAQTGAHKINNALGQCLLAKRMGKARVIAETGAGQHGLATAAAAAKLGLECEVFMGEVDMARQHPNVFGMRMFGARVTPVREGSRTLTDAVNAAMKNWTERVADTHYVLGSALGAHPYPAIVRELQSVIGREIKAQVAERAGRLPDRIYACVGGGSNSIGAFAPFLDEEVELVGAEAGGRGSAPGQHATRMSIPGIAGPGGARGGSVGIVQAYKSLFLQDGDGSLLPTHSVSAGLDYAGIGPQLAHLGETGRVRFASVSDDEALAAVARTARAEGVLPALESAHALALAFREAPGLRELKPGALVVVNVSGRGDKDLFITAPIFDRADWLSFLESEATRIRLEDEALAAAAGDGAMARRKAEDGL
jgi:tryptophan synthase beta chain